jgi:hypothetical protein
MINVLETATLMASDGDNETKEQMIKTVKMELSDARGLSWQFDLRTDDDTHLYVFITPSLQFFHHYEDRKYIEVSALQIIQRLRISHPVILGEILKTLGQEDKITSTALAVAMLANPIPSSLSAHGYDDYAKEQIKYANAAENKVRYMLSDHRNTVMNRISFVIGTVSIASVEFMFDQYPLIFCLVHRMPKSSRLFALARVTYENWPKIVNVDRVGSLVKGACKKISSELAKLFISQKTYVVNIESINNSANMCYLKSYLPFYKYGIMTATTTSQFSALIDESSVDIWLARYNTSYEQKSVIIYGTVFMQYARDAETLLTLKKGKFVEYGHAGLEIYCEVTDGVSNFIDHFIRLGNEKGNNWSRRVFIIARPEEYRAKFPHKKQRMSEENDDE